VSSDDEPPAGAAPGAEGSSDEPAGAAPGANAETALRKAYQERSEEVYVTRGVLAEAVSALIADHDARREEVNGLRDHLESLVAENVTLQAELRDAHHRIAELRAMRAVRWSRRARELADRIRPRPG